MGHSQAEKAETHQRIVDVAARRFRELGLEGISVADIMKEAGMTVGGFYKHFASRDDLVVEALAAVFAENENSELVSQPTLKKSIQTYLSEKHRDDLHSSCGVSSLVSELPRSSDDAREVFTERVMKSVSLLEGQISSEIEGNHRAQAMLIYSAMVGAIGMSRAVADTKLSRQILQSVAAELIALFSPKSSPSSNG
ncbi:TetR/AcrR family transcriptional regulator [Paraburkholderia caledonica]|uniref:TetR/AcrR family transcriptional regulator n=1 Tax=Paraburkholderia caledonica TaxID=134536 RepID=UPI000B3F6BA9|nr:TetR/AcrR family transcriptional regulator [Paraburkholderia caledonica]